LIIDEYNYPEMNLNYVKCRWFNTKFQTLPVLLTVLLLSSCIGEPGKKKSASPAELKYYGGKGVGPVTAIQLHALDSNVATAGKVIFQSKCVSCHYADERRLIGPGLGGVTVRRTPEWIMNQILNPLEMTQKDSLAKELLAVYLAQMTPMNLSEREAREVLEYLRSNDAQLK
jgi:mono/diheme cytochrome c family protein